MPTSHRSLVLAAVGSLAAVSCVPQPWERGPAFAVGSLPAGDQAAFARSVASRLGPASLGAVEVVSAMRWRPAEDAQLWVWVACRGRGNDRACVVAAARAPARGSEVRVLGAQGVGWAIPQIDATADRTELVVQGDDGRGTWRQQARFFGDNGGSVWFGRRMYTDGL